MVRTYPYGYHGVRLTREQLDLKWTWYRLHPELRHRLLALFDAHPTGALGLGEGARNAALQDAEFRRRHYRNSTGGIYFYDGSWWMRYDWAAPLAPPGRSNHDDGILDGFALAADLVGWEDHWFDRHCHEFGLKNFGGAVGPDVNGEEWHAQMAEMPNSRQDVNAWIAAGHRPTPWNPPPKLEDPKPPAPPATPLEDDMIVLDWRPGESKWTAFIWNGISLAWIESGHADNVLRRVSAKRQTVTDAELEGIIGASKTTTRAPHTLSATLKNLWNERKV